MMEQSDTFKKITQSSINSCLGKFLDKSQANWITYHNAVDAIHREFLPVIPYTFIGESSSRIRERLKNPKLIVETYSVFHSSKEFIDFFRNEDLISMYFELYEDENSFILLREDHLLGIGYKLYMYDFSYLGAEDRELFKRSL